MQETIFGKTEQTVNRLRSLYKQYGYKKYKMSRFETYDFYLENRDFLQSEHVITFTDLRGRLMALKPDVTLSIVKNAAGEKNELQKYFYHENVFRMMEGTHEFREILQVGLEYIGRIDLYAVCEVLMLARKSLEEIGEPYLLEISHMGLVSDVLKGTGLHERAQRQALKLIGQKNIHELRKLCYAAGLAEEDCTLLEQLASLYGPFAEVLPKVRVLAEHYARPALAELEAIYQALEESDQVDGIHLDFSITNDMRYYNGIIFQGYVQGVARSVLSGGRYDGLLHKFSGNSRAGAIGFAVYADQLEAYASSRRQYDADVVLCYDAEASVAGVLQAVQQLTAQGLTVRAQAGSRQEIPAARTLYYTKRGLESGGTDD
jgi:ATP phosphoribosyltransferase regulatory subunit